MNVMIDLDGVLVDFDQGFEKLTGYSPEDYEEKFSKKRFWKIIENAKNFWKNLPKISDSDVLWNFVKDYSPTILTTPGGNIEECKKEKKEWVNKNLGDYKILFSFHKETYADNKTVLIDDRKDNIDKFRSAGGIGILHTSAKKTISELKKILPQKKLSSIRNIEDLLTRL
jgi:FMN phosphatase YigB (HAD superfamily)